MVQTPRYLVNNRDFVLTIEPVDGFQTILTIPHDGFEALNLDGLFNRRNEGIISHDLRTWQIARQILLNSSSAAVCGLLSRKFVDYNRKPEEAFEEDMFRQSYQAYYQTIENLILKTDSNQCLLIDIHGFVNQPSYAPVGGYDLIMGTANRKTIVHGKVDYELAEHLSACGYRVFLPGEKPVNSGKHDKFNGGYTVRYIKRVFKINTIQIEIAPWLREKSSDKAAQLARDLATFIQARQ